MTKHQIDAELVPHGVLLHVNDNFSSLELEEMCNFSYVLHLCLNSDSIEQAYEMFLEDNELIIDHDARKSDVSLLFQLIDILNLKDFLIRAISEFADIPDDDFFTITVVGGQIHKEAISCYLDGYDGDFLVSARQVGIQLEKPS